MGGALHEEKVVRRYHKVFLERCEELSNYANIIVQIEKGEAKIEKRMALQKHLEDKIKSCKNPFQQLRISYGQNRGKNFTEEEDRYLICKLYQLGYQNENVYDELRTEVRREKQFRFDWFLKSRTSAELQRRCTTLLQLIIKENEELENAGSRSKKRKGESTDSGKKKRR